MANDIVYLTLQDVCEVITDGAHFSPQEELNGLPMASVKDLTRFGVDIDGCKRIGRTDFLNLVQQGCSPNLDDILIAKDGNSALDTVCVYRQNDKIVLLSSLAILRPDKNKITPDYLNYYLDSPVTRAMLKEGYRSGSAIPRVVLKDFRRAPIPIPSLDTQRTISSVLRSLDNKIELNRRMNRTLEQMARALFKSWFVDFAPVRARMRGEQPEGMDAETAALFPDELVEVDGREVPKGWAITTIGDLSEAIFSGGTPDTRKPEYWNAGIPWFSSGETRNNFVIGTEKTVSLEGVQNSSTRPAKPGDILIAGAGQGFTRGQASLNTINTYINQSVVAIRPSKKIYSYWLYLNMSSRYEEMRGISDGHSSRGSLTTKLVAQMPIIHPSKNVLKVFENTVTPVVEAQIRNEKESVHLAHLRDALLPRLLSGELDVSGWAEAPELVYAE